MNDKTSNMSKAEITEALDRVHRTPDSNALDDVIAQLQWLTLAKVEW